ncbi:MAG TPA: hypothetical protein DGB32_09125 [Dehalococcoidia bacterium]|nr:plastocyanin/azurin family copper-binding protein [Dehalococcoidia bacterium]HCV28476.1 hypothetical protein [Dehalococcoidia bacterium]
MAVASIRSTKRGRRVALDAIAALLAFAAAGCGSGSLSTDEAEPPASTVSAPTSPPATTAIVTSPSLLDLTPATPAAAATSAPMKSSGAAVPTPENAPSPTSPVPTPALPGDDSATVTSTPTPPPTATATVAPPADTAANIIGFAHPNVTVATGTTITWTNQDDAPHTNTSGGPGATTGETDGEVFDPGGAYSLRFDVPGQFAYFCTIHHFM